MNKENQYLLDTLNIIEESAMDAELDVLISINDEYLKTALLLEYASDEIVQECELFQEASIIQKNAKELKNDNDSKENERKSLIQKIIGWFKNIGKIIINFFKRIFNISDENIAPELPPKEVQRAIIAKGIKEIYNFKAVEGYETYWDEDHERVLTPKEVKEAENGDPYIKITSKEYNEIAGHDIYKGIFLKSDFSKPKFEEINAFEKRPWSDWIATMEFYVLGGYGKMIQELLTENMILDKQFDRQYQRAYDDYVDSHPIKSAWFGEKFVKMKASQVVTHNIRKIIKSQKEWKKICDKVIKNKWTKKITTKQFEEALSHFKGNPTFTHDGEMIFETELIANKNSDIDVYKKPFMFILDPSQLTIKVRTKGYNNPVDISNYVKMYEDLSKLFVDTVNDHRKDFNDIGNDFIKSFDSIIKKNAKTSTKDLTIYELSDLLKDNGKTFGKVKENLDIFNRGLENLQSKEGNTDQMKALFVKMTSASKEFTNLMSITQSLLKHAKDSIIIFKVYIAFLECVGSKGYVSGDFVLNPEITLDKVHLVQFLKAKEFQHTRM